jgi:chromosome segregation ATPase
VIDLQNEKRNLFKKNQEIEELRRNLRASDDRLIEIELKSSDKENDNNELRTRISKLEAELTRLDKEYNKLRYRYS